MWASEVVDALRGGTVAAAAYAVPMSLLSRAVRPAHVRTAAAIGAGVVCFRLARAALTSHWNDLWAVAATAAAGGTLVACAVDGDLATSLVVSYALTKGAREFLPSIAPTDGLMTMVPVAVVSLASAIVLPAAYLRPEFVHGSMQSFLENWVRKLGVTVQQWRVPPPGRDLSAGIHPDQSLLGFVLLRATPSTMFESIKIMAPFYALWTALAALQSRSLAAPLRHNIEGLLRSVTFQTGFVSTTWLMTLGFSKYYSRGALSLAQATSLAWVGGLWAAVERLPRRVELAAFFCAHAMSIMYRRSRIRANAPLGALLLALGVAPVVAKWSTAERERRNRLVRLVLF